MIRPTVGRVVWFREIFAQAGPEPQPQAAIVTYVHGDRCVNLAVFSANGIASGRTSVPLRQADDAAPQGMYCEWMPYQHGQAAKTEAAQETLAAVIAGKDPEVDNRSYDAECDARAALAMAKIERVKAQTQRIRADTAAFLKDRALGPGDVDNLLRGLTGTEGSPS